MARRIRLGASILEKHVRGSGGGDEEAEVWESHIFKARCRAYYRIIMATDSRLETGRKTHKRMVNKC